MSFVAVDDVLKGEAEMRSSNVVANVVRKSLKLSFMVLMILAFSSGVSYGNRAPTVNFSKTIQEKNTQPLDFFAEVKSKFESLKNNEARKKFKEDFRKALEKSSLEQNKKDALKRIFDAALDPKKGLDDFLKENKADVKLLSGKKVTDEDVNIMEQLELLRRNDEAKDSKIAELMRQLMQKPTGETNDWALQQIAWQICANEINKQKKGNIDEKIQPLKDALNEILNQMKGLSRRPKEEAKDKNALEDLLPELLKNLMKPEEEKESGDNPESPSSSGGGSPEQEKGKSPFDQPLPEPKEDEKLPPQQEMPLMFPIQPKNEQIPPINLNLPTNTGRRELRDVQDALAELESRTPITNTLMPGAGLADLVMAKAKVQGEKERVQSVLQAAKDRLNKLDEQIEELKEGGEAALPSWVKRKEAELEAKIKKYDNAIEQTQQSAQQAAKNPQAIALIQVRIQQLNQLKSKAEEDLAKFRAEKESMIEEANKAIKKLARRRDSLQSVVSKLEGKIKGLNEEEAAVQQMINQQMQLQLQMIQGNAGSPVRTVTQPQGAATQPRTPAPGGLGLGGATSAPNTSGGGFRAPLAK